MALGMARGERGGPQQEGDGGRGHQGLEVGVHLASPFVGGPMYPGFDLQMALLPPCTRGLLVAETC